ncbi:MerR family transcriptional regulator [Miniphocaeibacter halophilus]|uniref:MerR family transcriptional regulator n=1 Tax=Miniphocaeibacter halophilus TaxID=2931922 RepID=A0AC61MRW1_9FIRM|nr:MerR family transcriptional regulator [Miniphocaeibacter halophilus]QQK08256.1 MerR family transcriptional regulator [Miniphocaeibacter halophilus]
MYKISEFSKITNLTIKTLYYYDKEKILEPFSRDENGHRLYNEDNFKQAKLIKTLRYLDFSISEMKEVVANCQSQDDLFYYLLEKKKNILDDIKKKEGLIEYIDLYLNKEINEEEREEHYCFKLVEIEEKMVLSYRYKGKYSDVGKYIDQIHKVGKDNITGNSFCLYYDYGFEDEAEIEVCIPVSKKIKTYNSIEFKVIPSVKGVKTNHIGSYESIYRAYKNIIDYCNKNNYIMKTPTREVHIKGPGKNFKGNPKKYITEIIIPIGEEDGKEI